MAKLMYVYLVSLDGYVEDETGKIDWSVPDDEFHAFINELMRPVGTYLYGRRMYETMAVWETDPSIADQSPLMREFAEIWQAADKIVYSTSLATVVTARTRIERDLDLEAVRRLKVASADDIAIGGAGLAAHALKAALIDECHLFVVPIALGGGKRLFPEDVRLELELLDERRFGNGMVYLHYQLST